MDKSIRIQACLVKETMTSSTTSVAQGLHEPMACVLQGTNAILINRIHIRIKNLYK
jgi:hypothetical protein